MLASVAIEPAQFVLSEKQNVRMTPSVLRPADPERQKLIEEIESVEGVPLGHVPMLFRFVLLCGGVICVGASYGLALRVADLVSSII